MLPTSGYVSFVLCGFGGFLYYSLSRNAMISLGLSAAGIIGISLNISLYIHKHGLLAFLPDDLVDLLLRKSLIEVIAEGKLPKRISKKINEFLPLFLAKTENERHEALDNLTEDSRDFFTTRGLINTFSNSSKRLILPNEEYLKLLKNDEIEYSHYGSARGTQDEVNRTLIPKFIRRKISRTNLKLVLEKVNPKICKFLGMLCSLILILQLRFSRTSREILTILLKLVCLLSTSFGLVFSILFLIFYSKAKVVENRRQARMKKLKNEANPLPIKKI